MWCSEHHRFLSDFLICAHVENPKTLAADTRARDVLLKQAHLQEGLDDAQHGHVVTQGREKRFVRLCRLVMRMPAK